VTAVVYAYELLVTSKERARIWTLAAEAAGLTDVSISKVAGRARHLSGRAGALEVSLQRFFKSGKQKGTRIVISGLGHAETALSFQRETLTARLNPRIELGDGEFDRAVYLYGLPDLACAIFDAPTRWVTSRLVQGSIEGTVEGGGRSAWVDFEGQVSLENGALRLNIGEPSRGTVAEQLSAALPLLLAIARRLVQPSDLAGALVRNLREDPLPAVRLENLRALIEGHRAAPGADEALVAALGDASEEVRLHAALALGERGHDTLRAIASSDGGKDRHAAQATAALGKHFPLEQAVQALTRAVSTRQPARAQACVDTLARSGGPEAEAALIAALSARDAAVLSAVAGALERVGTVAAVMPLREAAERVRELRRTAERAVGAIQSRIEGASPGQLSLAAGEAGQVSLVEDAHGRLSVPDEPR
jgi:hypothetical protein